MLLSKSDPLVVCTTMESGERVSAGCGELHVEISDPRDFAIGDPVVSHQESVAEFCTEVDSGKCSAKMVSPRPGRTLLATRTRFKRQHEDTLVSGARRKLERHVKTRYLVSWCLPCGATVDRLESVTSGARYASEPHVQEVDR